MAQEPWPSFEANMRVMAEQLRYAYQRLPRLAASRPAEVAGDLTKIDVALTKALQALVSVELKDAPHQDIMRDKFNWPVVLAIQAGLRSVHTDDPAQADLRLAGGYPSQAVRMLLELRDAAREARRQFPSKPGNSSSRTEKGAMRAAAGFNFVNQYRMHFGKLPPVSRTGRAVECMRMVLVNMGTTEVDAAAVLRTAIDNYKKSGGPNMAT